MAWRVAVAANPSRRYPIAWKRTWKWERQRSESIYIRISVRLAQFSTVIVPFGNPILVVIARGLFVLMCVLSTTSLLSLPSLPLLTFLSSPPLLSWIHSPKTAFNKMPIEHTIYMNIASSIHLNRHSGARNPNKYPTKWNNIFVALLFIPFDSIPWHGVRGCHCGGDVQLRDCDCVTDTYKRFDLENACNA